MLQQHMCMCWARIVGSTLGALVEAVKVFPPCARGMEAMHESHRWRWICFPANELDEGLI